MWQIATQIAKTGNWDMLAFAGTDWAKSWHSKLAFLRPQFSVWAQGWTSPFGHYAGWGRIPSWESLAAPKALNRIEVSSEVTCGSQGFHVEKRDLKPEPSLNLQATTMVPCGEILLTGEISMKK